MARRRKNRPNVAARAPAARWPAFVSGCVAGAVAMLVIDALGPEPGREGGADGAPGSEAGAGGEPASQMPRFEFYHILPEMEVALPHLSAGEAALAPAEPPEEPEPAASAAAEPPAGEAEAEAAPPPAESAAALVAAQPAEAAAEAAQPPEEPAATEPAAGPSEPPAAASAEVAAAPASPPVEPAEAAARPSETLDEPGSVYVLQVASFRSIDDADGMRARLALLGLEAVVQTVAIDGEAAWHRVRVGPYTELRALNRARIRLRENHIESLALKVRSP